MGVEFLEKHKQLVRWESETASCTIIEGEEQEEVAARPRGNQEKEEDEGQKEEELEKEGGEEERDPECPVSGSSLTPLSSSSSSNQRASLNWSPCLDRSVKAGIGLSSSPASSSHLPKGAFQRRITTTGSSIPDAFVSPVPILAANSCSGSPKSLASGHFREFEPRREERGGGGEAEGEAHTAGGSTRGANESCSPDRNPCRNPPEDRFDHTSKPQFLSGGVVGGYGGGGVKSVPWAQLRQDVGQRSAGEGRYQTPTPWVNLPSTPPVGGREGILGTFSPKLGTARLSRVPGLGGPASVSEGDKREHGLQIISLGRISSGVTGGSRAGFAGSRQKQSSEGGVVESAAERLSPYSRRTAPRTGRYQGGGDDIPDTPVKKEGGRDSFYLDSSEAGSSLVSELTEAVAADVEKPASLLNLSSMAVGDLDTMETTEQISSEKTQSRSRSPSPSPWLNFAPASAAPYGPAGAGDSEKNRKFTTTVDVRETIISVGSSGRKQAASPTIFQAVAEIALSKTGRNRGSNNFVMTSLGGTGTERVVAPAARCPLSGGVEEGPRREWIDSPKSCDERFSWGLRCTGRPASEKIHRRANSTGAP